MLSAEPPTSGYSSVNQTLERADRKPFSVGSLSLQSVSVSSNTITLIGERWNGSRVTLTTSFGIFRSSLDLVSNGFSDLTRLRWYTSSPAYIDDIEVVSTSWQFRDVDFGAMPNPGSIAGTVYFDDNQNGVLDSAEKPVVGRKNLFRLKQQQSGGHRRTD